MGTGPIKQIQRIGLVLSAAPGYSETFFRNKIEGLQAQGFEVVLFIVEGSKKEPIDIRCDVVSAPKFKGSALQVFVQSVFVFFKALLASPRVSFRHFQLDIGKGFPLGQCIKRLLQNAFMFGYPLDWLHFGFGMLAVGREHVAEAIGAQMAVSFRGFDLYLSPLKHPDCYALLFITKVRYHVLSYEMKQDLMVHGIPESAIYVISPAIDVQFFKDSTGSFESKTLVASKVLQIVTVARLHWKKGLEYSLEAMTILKKQGVPFHYTIVGDGPEYERLVFAAQQLGIREQVTFAGSLSPDLVKEHLEAADVYVQYSIQEGFCNAVLEAQAMGVLCVVSDAEGLSENVLHKDTGWVVPKRQPLLLAGQIQLVANLDPLVAKEIRCAAIDRVQRGFNLEEQQRAFVGFYL
ncbi:glycosyltransferase [Mangrovimonas xylaniphaga]|uniref:glycosyltransferase n=1 Tax=Mangrovimonas xylaniphaga TaxID=1645915 RepID=UPI0006B590BA|nr:glycosyltransferase [Mangrovimonas xylaniphaga]